MGRKAKVLVQEKIRAVEDYLLGKRTASQICYELEINKSLFKTGFVNIKIKEAKV